MTDNNGCSTTQSVTVGKATGTTLAIANSEDVSCFGENDGSAEVSATGGTAATATGLVPGAIRC